MPPRSVSNHIAEVLDKHVRGEPSLAEIAELVKSQNELLQSIEVRLRRLEEQGVVQITGDVLLSNVPESELTTVETPQIADALDKLGRD